MYKRVISASVAILFGSNYLIYSFHFFFLFQWEKSVLGLRQCDEVRLSVSGICVKDRWWSARINDLKCCRSVSLSWKSPVPPSTLQAMSTASKFHSHLFWSLQISLKSHHAVSLPWMTTCRGDQPTVWHLSLLACGCKCCPPTDSNETNFLMISFTTLHISCTKRPLPCSLAFI